MDYRDIFASIGAVAFLNYAYKLLCFLRICWPQVSFPLPKKFLRSMGEWAVVTGGSDGIGRGYAFELARQGMDVVILSRSKDKLERTAKEIEEETGQRVRVLVADFTQDNIYGEIEDQLKGLEVAVLVNNVGILPSVYPGKFLETPNINQTISNVINCNTKSMAKMCSLCLPGMVKRGKGVILNISSGVATVPIPLFSLYGASKVFVDRLSSCLQAEYRENGIIIQAIAPFTVSTSMTNYSKVSWKTISSQAFVKSSLQYLTAGDKINGSVIHTIMALVLLAIPSWILQSQAMQKLLIEYTERVRIKKQEESS